MSARPQPNPLIQLLGPLKLLLARDELAPLSASDSIGSKESLGGFFWVELVLSDGVNDSCLERPWKSKSFVIWTSKRLLITIFCILMVSLIQLQWPIQPAIMLDLQISLLPFCSNYRETSCGGGVCDYWLVTVVQSVIVLLQIYNRYQCCEFCTRLLMCMWIKLFFVCEYANLKENKICIWTDTGKVVFFFCPNLKKVFSILLFLKPA